MRLVAHTKQEAWDIANQLYGLSVFRVFAPNEITFEIETIPLYTKIEYKGVVYPKIFEKKEDENVSPEGTNV